MFVMLLVCEILMVIGLALVVDTIKTKQGVCERAQRIDGVEREVAIMKSKVFLAQT